MMVITAVLIFFLGAGEERHPVVVELSTLDTCKVAGGDLELKTTSVTGTKPIWTCAYKGPSAQ